MQFSLLKLMVIQLTQYHGHLAYMSQNNNKSHYHGEFAYLSIITNQLIQNLDESACLQTLANLQIMANQLTLKALRMYLLKILLNQFASHPWSFCLSLYQGKTACLKPMTILLILKSR